jgi:HAD superfamily hydrolase (TIGR01509 family)
MARAILWDMDGVLVNSMEFHYQAYREVLAEFGRDLSREEYLTSLIGLRNYVILRRLLGDLPQQEVERLMAAKENAFRRRVRGNVTPLPGAAELVLRAHEAGLKQAIVSSTPCENIELVLNSLGLRSMYDTIVGEEDAQHGKPDPEGFRIGAERLSVAPPECVVLEDAPEGIAGGKGAAMRCIGVTTTRPAEKLIEAGADLVVASLEDERVWQFIAGA